jgi:non-heme chloroperoxidase
MTAPFVEIAGGHQLFVRDWGTGAPMMLLAGWAMDSRIWGETMLALNTHGLRTVAYDRRGHGRSTDPGEADYNSLAGDLAAVLEALDLRDVTLVCHSGAGGEAIRYISRYGLRRLARLVLVGATGPAMMASADDRAGIPPDMVDALQAQLATDLAGWIDANIDPFAPGANPRVNAWMSHMVLGCSRRIAVDFQRAIVTADFSNETATLTIPVTIIHGDQDVSAPIDRTARRYASLIPGAELLVYEGAAHGVMVTHSQRLAMDIARRVAPD